MSDLFIDKHIEGSMITCQQSVKLLFNLCLTVYVIIQLYHQTDLSSCMTNRMIWSL